MAVSLLDLDATRGARHAIDPYDYVLGALASQRRAQRNRLAQFLNGIVGRWSGTSPEKHPC